MPFVAYIQGEKVNVLDVSQEDWEARKETHPEVIMPCCGLRGSMATSKRGRPFFKHRPDSGCSGAEESEEHRECKRIIYLTAKASGFDAEMEAPGDDWIADVLVQTQAGKLAFEVQRTGQTAKETARRSMRYDACDVMPIWFTKASLVEDLSAYVPIFEIDMADIADIKVRMPNFGFISLEDGVRKILREEIHLKKDLDAYVPPWYQAEDHDALALSGEGLKILGYIALGILGLIGLVCFLDAHKPRR